jgi:hypothetical protein
LVRRACAALPISVGRHVGGNLGAPIRFHYTMGRQCDSLAHHPMEVKHMSHNGQPG